YGKDYEEALMQNAEKIRICDTREELEEILNTGRKETIRLSVEKVLRELRGKLPAFWRVLCDLPAFWGYGLSKKELVAGSVTRILDAQEKASAGM
ncbi:MAG: hypothetical protein IJS42_01955, partial [Synergistaceae bacterium]|nr:hypothetical protein [Synergistaceae bacterium]